MRHGRLGKCAMRDLSAGVKEGRWSWKGLHELGISWFSFPAGERLQCMTKVAVELLPELCKRTWNRAT